MAPARPPRRSRSSAASATCRCWSSRRTRSATRCGSSSTWSGASQSSREQRLRALARRAEDGIEGEEHGAARADALVEDRRAPGRRAQRPAAEHRPVVGDDVPAGDERVVVVEHHAGAHGDRRARDPRRRPARGDRRLREAGRARPPRCPARAIRRTSRRPRRRRRPPPAPAPRARPARRRPPRRHRVPRARRRRGRHRRPRRPARRGGRATKRAQLVPALGCAAPGTTDASAAGSPSSASAPPRQRLGRGERPARPPPARRAAARRACRRGGP